MADRLTRRTTRLLREPVVDLPRATCDYFSVLDGRTLHVHALLPTSAVAVEQATLLFIQNSKVVVCPASAETIGDRISVTARAAFGTGPDEISLGKGIWSVVVAVPEATGERRFALQTTEPADHDGPTVQNPPHPVSGWRFEPGCGTQGLAHLTVKAAKARAEVLRLATGPTEARISGRLVGVGSLQDPMIVFTPRGDGADVMVPIAPVNGQFEFTVPVAELAVGPPGAEVIWEAWVRTSPTRMVRLGRFLHDLRDPRTVLRVSRTTVTIEDRRFVGYRPYYTKAGNLAVACLHFTGAST
ncbi:hypothetical protein ACFFMR_14695 [Micromonospora andamanensis]|uniref:hypothetical protein n=1 Tax=Micromonospora andamanensis TaxID=1287068 RepID=UPI00194E610C|nr:hypothetical protein [Micromonospora andamanensis]